MEQKLRDRITFNSCESFGSPRIFFDACDGIFLNYIWSEAHLMRSASAAGNSRRPDVYVGVDVFGRGCYGGGGYSCNKVSWCSSYQVFFQGVDSPRWKLHSGLGFPSCAEPTFM